MRDHKEYAYLTQTLHKHYTYILLSNTRTQLRRPARTFTYTRNKRYARSTRAARISTAHATKRLKQDFMTRQSTNDQSTVELISYQ